MKNNLLNEKRQMKNDLPRVAIVCDWLVGGGAERVAEELHRMFPDAPIYTSYCAAQWRDKLDNKVVTGFLQHWPFAKLRKFVPFFRIWWFSRLKLKGYDVIISSSGAEAKYVRAPSGTLHISYIHAPTHYYWSRYEQYLKNPGFGKFDWIARLGLKFLVGPLRKSDYRAAQRPDYLIANSTHTQAEIKKYYGRESSIVFPPVDIARFNPAPAKPQDRSGFVTAGRQTPYKRIDLAVKACTQLDLRLVVIGRGPEHTKLVEMAGPSIRFITNAHDETIVHNFRLAEAFIFPSNVEDFGVVAVEALAAGTPVIAYRAGGPVDYITEETGIFFEQQTVESLEQAIKNFDPSKYSPSTLQKTAARFSNENFRKHMQQILTELTTNKR